MAELPSPIVKDNKLIKGIFAVVGIMSLVIYGLLQGSKKALDPVAPLYKYCIVSVSNILTTTCQYEALKYVTFPVQTLAKCAKVIPVMIWGTLIMQKKYQGQDYFLAFLVTIGCALFILYPVTSVLTVREGKVQSWDKLFKGYDMEIHNQIFYTTLCSCFLSFSGLISRGNLFMAIDFVSRNHDCFFDILFLSTVATASQFSISFIIRNFGALTFATIMTTRQLVSILLSCIWFGHPLSWEQCVGAVIVFGSLYAKSFLKKNPKQLPIEDSENGVSIPPKGANT